MLTKKKKILIIVGMVLLLAVSCILNITLNNNAVSTGGQNTAYTNVFDAFRNDRLSLETRELSFYDAIIASANSTELEISQAQQKKAEILELSTKQSVAENLIKAKGFDDAYVKSSNSLISCVVKTESLGASEVAKIYTILVEQLGATINNVEIIPIS